MPTQSLDSYCKWILKTETKDPMSYIQMHKTFKDPNETIHEIVEYGLQDVLVLKQLDEAAKVIRGRMDVATGFGMPPLMGLYYPNTWFVKFNIRRYCINYGMFLRTDNEPQDKDRKSIEGAFNYSYGEHEARVCSNVW